MKSIVIYYSKTGNNKYVAERIASTLKCDIESLKPIINSVFFLFIGLGFGIKKLHSNIGDYDRIILCGPIWAEKLSAPLQFFIKKYLQSIKKLVFVTACQSSYEKKDEKYGHGLVFKNLENWLKEKCMLCQAFPLPLVLPNDKKEDFKALHKVQLNDENFKGEINERFDDFITKLKI